MGRKVVYKLGYSIKPGTAQGNLPKKTRGLLLQLQLAEESKQYEEADALLNQLGDLYEEAEDIPKTIDIAKRELRLALVLSGTAALKTKTRALCRLSEGYRELEQFQAAIDYSKQYIAVAQELKDESEQLHSFFQLALAYTARWESNEQLPNDNKDAEKAWRHAAALVKNVPKEAKEDAKADINLNLGITYKHAGEYDKAIQHMSKALEHYRRQGNRAHEAKAYFNLGSCYHEKGDAEESIQYALKEQQILHSMGDVVNEARTFWDIALRCREYWRYGQALDALRSYKNLCEVLDDEDGRKAAFTAIREVEECISKQQRIEELSTALMQPHQQQDLRKYFDVLGERGELLLSIGKTAQSIKDFEEQKRLSFALKLSKQRLEKLLYHLGLSYAGEGRYHDAIRAYREALDKFAGDNRERLALLVKLADAYHETGASYDTISRSYEDVVKLAHRLSDLEIQKEGLHQLVWINQKHHYAAKADAYSARLKYVEDLLEKAQNSETPEDSFDPDLGSADPDMMTDAESDLENVGPLDRSHGANSADISHKPLQSHPRNELPSPQLRTAQQSTVASNARKQKTSKYQIHTIGNEIESVNEQISPGTLLKVSTCISPSRSPEIKRKEQPQMCDKKHSIKKRLRIDDSSSPPIPRFDQPNDLAPLPQSNRTKSRHNQTLSTMRSPFHQPSSSPTQLPPPIDVNQDTSIRRPSKPRSPIVIIDETPGRQMSVSPAPRLLFQDKLQRRATTPVNSIHQRTPGSTGSSVKSTTSGRSGQQSVERPMKIRVVIKDPQEKDEIFAISCPNGPNGTPKTIGWLMDEARRRYNDIYHTKPPILKFVTTDPETSEEETLGKEEVISHILVNKQKVIAIKAPGTPDTPKSGS
ncbi:uncharacterized protein SPPG_04941 [Spizellomyces punctatus DAOM BR117]|uniref:Uncharacterized protein n=1 Tax=Spizellomyces punctatus (strain DAOM BR117) TaxID=645134 RepID=A0A0L0HEN1_SPIPD|nr:uncharacterized protein SPPG_04941 [Spizellomyces punctatus DAOM BR117]KNC99552.1 hypothetical protein SPPG_04941 [Spizellomyces punctatus DAOM BR117]|eukprot:XP_016607592.1 hypothetical protein SPPG_04941 [Spizellomyces punctatus DAOM BR117]